MSDLPLGRKMAWMSYLALAIACLLVVTSALAAISALAVWVMDLRGALVLAVGSACSLIGVLAAIILASRRWIYRAWVALAGGMVPALMLIAVSRFIPSLS
jgi:hypothetical protein